MGRHKIAMSNEWNNGFFGCFSVKGCAMMPCCIPNCICCMPCMWGSATSQIKGKEDWGSFWKCCLAVQFCPCCTFCVAYRELTAHYGIEDSMWPLKVCLPSAVLLPDCRHDHGEGEAAHDQHLGCARWSSFRWPARRDEVSTRS